MTQTTCHCGSGKTLEDCCLPILQGRIEAPSAEALMRARYSAYAENALDFLLESLHPEFREDYDPEATAKWAQTAQWMSLKLVLAEDREVAEDAPPEAIVQFIAQYREDGMPRSHHEQSLFRQHEGRWYYVDGRMIAQPTVKRDGAKVGRNDPCPCGSGKKYKKCCGRAA